MHALPGRQRIRRDQRRSPNLW
ncbi:hypothetical protein GQ600_22565 [Phytophthora cactorum]|nr:hypothetical protein GQ600_22565 [Phytophthora cactorum]